MTSYATALAAARDMKECFLDYGVKCSIELQMGRGSDAWAVPTKYHRMHHHTVSRYVPGGNLTPILALCKRGRTDVPGPLCNGYGGYDHVYRIVCMGLANHPGQGGPITIDGVRIPENSAREPTWGTEWEGGIQDWDNIPGMLEFMGKADNALVDYTGRPITSQMEHSTWAPDRKIDRLNFTRELGIALTRRWRIKDGFDMDANEFDNIFAQVLKGQVTGGDSRKEIGAIFQGQRELIVEEVMAALGDKIVKDVQGGIDSTLKFYAESGNSPVHDIVRDVLSTAE